MIPRELIKLEIHGTNNADGQSVVESVVAYVVAGLHKDVEVRISMSGDNEQDAVDSLQEYAESLFRELNKMPDSRLGNLPRIQRDFLREHFTMHKKEKVTGYQIRASLDEAKLTLGLVSDQFDDSLFKFEDEEKQSPRQVAENIRKAEAHVANLQAVQERYNQQVSVTVQGITMTLALAIKLRGTADRISALWKKAISNKSNSVRSRFHRDDPTKRNKDDVFAKRTITKEEAADEAKMAGRWNNALKSAIAKANLQEVEMEVDFELE